jgi:SAM-dependent methyltransferase
VSCSRRSIRGDEHPGEALPSAWIVPRETLSTVETPQTWHYGVVAQWWAERNLDGPEIDYFRTHIERHGQPALDVACGTGRLLVPYLRAGLDVDGCDVSPDMLAWCATRAEREGLTPRLYAQAMHELDLPRRYRTVIVCGAFGLGGSRDRDRESLRRMRGHLEPGGVLVMDYESRSAGEPEWRQWAEGKLASLPEPSIAPELVPAADGSEIGLRARIVDIDLATRVVTSEMRAQRWRGGRLEADETHPLKACVYFRDEVLAMLADAGFGAVEVSRGYGGTGARESRFLVFEASRDG